MICTRSSRRSEGSVIRQYERAFRAYGIEASFTDGALARARRTRRRGAHRRARPVDRDRTAPARRKYELPGSGVERLVGGRGVHGRSGCGDARRLARARPRPPRAGPSRRRRRTASRRGFRRLPRRRFALRRRGRPSSSRERAQAERVPMTELCERLFKDYQFGLKLIQKNTGQNEFRLPVAAVDDPDKFISELVVNVLPGKPRRRSASAADRTSSDLPAGSLRLSMPLSIRFPPTVSRALKFTLLNGVLVSLLLALVHLPGFDAAAGCGDGPHARPGQPTAESSVAAMPDVYRAGLRHRLDDHRHQSPAFPRSSWPPRCWRRCSPCRRWHRSTAHTFRRFSRWRRW